MTKILFVLVMMLSVASIQCYVVSILSNKLFDAKDIFIIDNKQFYCKQLHYKVRLEGISKEVEGTFYPM